MVQGGQASTTTPGVAHAEHAPEEEQTQQPPSGRWPSTHVSVRGRRAASLGQLASFSTSRQRDVRSAGPPSEATQRALAC